MHNLNVCRVGKEAYDPLDPPHCLARLTMCSTYPLCRNKTANNEDNGNSTADVPSIFQLDLGDTNWVMTSSFIIFTMQTGFGMLESGCVSIKNEVNIMMKNVADVVLGGLTYWMFGFGMSFGRGPYTTPFMGVGDFFVDPEVTDPIMGPTFAAFIFQLSFATTATTIVSGAMAERCNFKAYCLFSCLNTVVYCIPAGWAWGEHGFLHHLGYVDIAGSGPVHLIGGSSALASAWMLGPRLGRYELGNEPMPLGSPVNAVMGLFVLWWGWLAFNSGSTYGVSGSKWHYAARAAVQTMMSSFGGGCVGLGYSMFLRDGKLDIMDLINSILGALVAITAGCFLYRSWEALLIGVVGAIVTCLAMPLIDKMQIDDPVGAAAVHGVAAIWGVIAVGLFADNPFPLDTTNGRTGLFKNGGWYMVGVQTLGAFCFAVWGMVSTTILLWMVNKIVPIRMEPYDELLGADLVEHHIRHGQAGVSRALSALRPFHKDEDGVETIRNVGSNPGHEKFIHEKYVVNADQLQTPKFTSAQINKSAKLNEKNHKRNKLKRKSSKVNIKNKSNTKDNTLATLEALAGSAQIPRFAWID